MSSGVGRRLLLWCSKDPAVWLAPGAPSSPWSARRRRARYPREGGRSALSTDGLVRISKEVRTPGDTRLVAKHKAGIALCCRSSIARSTRYQRRGTCRGTPLLVGESASAPPCATSGRLQRRLSGRVSTSGGQAIAIIGAVRGFRGNRDWATLGCEQSAASRTLVRRQGFQQLLRRQVQRGRKLVIGRMAVARRRLWGSDEAGPVSDQVVNNAESGDEAP